MGVKSYVAGLQSEAVSSVGAGVWVWGVVLWGWAQSAKDTADVNREKLSIEGKARMSSLQT